MNDNKMLKPDSSLYYLLHGMLIGTTVYTIYLSKPGSSLFSWHPFLMTLSMFLLMNEAVLLFSSKWSLLPKKYHRSQYMNIHIILEVMSLICFLLGFYSIYLNKDNLGKPHFTSWHGILGLIQLIAICAQVVIGTFAKYRILPVMLFPATKLKTVHVTLGITITMLVMCNLITGWYSNWFINNSSMFMFSILALMCISINGFISYRAMSTNSRVKNVLKLS